MEVEAKEAVTMETGTKDGSTGEAEAVVQGIFSLLTAVSSGSKPKPGVTSSVPAGGNSTLEQERTAGKVNVRLAGEILINNLFFIYIFPHVLVEN
jgi:hypothetical protein